MVRPKASKGEAGDTGRLVTVRREDLILHRRPRENTSKNLYNPRCGGALVVYSVHRRHRRLVSS